MKRWYWLILELLIIFGVMAWICFFPSDFEYDFAKGMVGFVLIYTIENYTIEQNAWENQIEGGVVSVSGSAKKTELKEVHESDKRSLALIAKKGADFEKAYNEAEELLDKQIEATYKVVEENKELKEENRQLRDEVEDLRAYCNQIGKVKAEVMKAFDHIVAK